MVVRACFWDVCGPGKPGRAGRSSRRELLHAPAINARAIYLMTTQRTASTKRLVSATPRPTLWAAERLADFKADEEISNFDSPCKECSTLSYIAIRRFPESELPLKGAPSQIRGAGASLGRLSQVHDTRFVQSLWNNRNVGDLGTGGSESQQQFGFLAAPTIPAVIDVVGHETSKPADRLKSASLTRLSAAVQKNALYIR